MKFSINQELANKSQIEQNRISKLIDNVTTLQLKNNMIARDDSLLTWKFATGQLPQATAVDVAKELVAVDLIYKNTSYSSIIEDTMRLVANHLVFEKKLPWGDAWMLTRKYIPDMLKLYCLEKDQYRLPEFIE